jgi:hypothetical protein
MVVDVISPNESLKVGTEPGQNIEPMTFQYLLRNLYHVSFLMNSSRPFIMTNSVIEVLEPLSAGH